MLHFRNSLKQALASGIVTLEDCGEGERLERFGECLLRRPSSQSIWRRTLAAGEWKKADASYVPQKGWESQKKKLSEWVISLGELKVKLLLQDNGQVGIFPEHLSYFEELSLSVEWFAKNLERKPRVLNLFAYTGIASIWCALHGAEVTHVELSKKVLSWAKENQELNPALSGSIRFIPEDALVFVDREVRRESYYDVIIADPPSFSRISKTQSWDLEDVAPALIASMVKILNDHGKVFATSHHPVLNAYAFENIFRDQKRNFRFEKRDLVIEEKPTQRCLPCGSLILAETV